MSLTAEDDIENIKSINSVSMILKLLRRSTGLRVGLVVSTRDSQMTVCAVGDDGDSGFNVGSQASLDAAFCRVIYETRQPLLINDASSDERFAGLPAHTQMGVKSYIGVPILVETGEMFGTVCAFDTVPAQLSAEDFEIFNLCAQVISQELQDERKKIARDKEFEKVSKTNQTRTKFMSILGHDLKNPLNAITMAARLQQMTSGGSAQISELSEKILRSAKTMQEMINDLLDVTRAEDGNLPITRKLSSVPRSVRYCLEEFRLANPNCRIDSLVEGDFEGEIDESRLCQLLSNLLGNAYRYGDSQRPIRVTLIDAGDDFILQVQNFGTPIPPEHLENLFLPYWRGEKERISHSQGLGLGLYIVNQIVKAHDGTISVTSDSEKGTVFTAIFHKFANK